MKLLKLVVAAELTREVNTELTFDSYGVPGLNLSCVQPPYIKLVVAEVDGCIRSEKMKRKVMTED